MANTKRRIYGTHVTTPAGERIYVSGRTKEERAKKVEQMKQAMQAGVNVADNSTFAEYARLWLQAYKAPPKIRPSSYSIVKHNLEAHVIPFFDGMLLKDVTPLHIQMYTGSIAQYSNSLQVKCIQIVRAIFRTAVDNHLIMYSPVSKDVRVTTAPPAREEPLTNEQAQQLLDAVRGTRAYGFCLLGLTTGMRRGEILGLMWEDIDFDKAEIHVTHNKAFPQNANDAPVTALLKTDAAARVLPVSPVLLAYLEQERKVSKSKFVVSMQDGRSLTRSSFRKLWDIVVDRTTGRGKELGTKLTGSHAESRYVTLDFDCHPHMLRHTFITMLFEQGLDLKQVQYLAGHATPDMTLRVYTHYRRSMRAEETRSKVACAVGMLG